MDQSNGTITTTAIPGKQPNLLIFHFLLEGQWFQCCFMRVINTKTIVRYILFHGNKEIDKNSLVYCPKM